MTKDEYLRLTVGEYVRCSKTAPRDGRLFRRSQAPIFTGKRVVVQKGNDYYLNLFLNVNSGLQSYNHDEVLLVRGRE